MSALQALQAAGVSIWLDTLSRDLIDSGRLSTLMDSFAVSGATSNPTIFANAIRASGHYDDQLRDLAAAGVTDPRELFFALALEDVGRAADLLRPLHEATRGTEGYVSFECTPDVAFDTDRTVHQALEVWRRLDRPNVLVKVPGTAAGAAAVAELTWLGVNVNITLLFSVDRYRQVIDAYQEGLERRRVANKPIDGVMSVASFFVSRVDALVDPQLPPDSPLRGQVAVANARAAYALFRQRFADPSWMPLQRAGGRPQRPLWASTATKDPAYSDVKYVEELVTPGAITTVPESTLEAFADHGRAVPVVEGGEPLEVGRLLAGHGVDLDRVSAELEAQGVAAFEASYQEALSILRTKAARLASAGGSVPKPLLRPMRPPPSER